MASTVTHLPHVKNVQAGIGHYDPMYQAIFEVYFNLPDAINQGEEESILLTEQVTKVTGLDDLNNIAQAGTQKFMGVDISYAQPTLEKTYAEFTITFNLNLRKGNDAYTFKTFKKWGKLNYDIATGARTLKADYIADNLRIAEANRDGEVWRSYIFHDVFILKITGLDELSYTEKEARTLQVTFRSDYWEEEIA